MTVLSSLRAAAVACAVCFAMVFAVRAAETIVQLGVVAQRYPWNGVVDVSYRVASPEAGAQIVFFANGVEVVRVAATSGEQKVSFDANAFDALKGKQLKDVKITTKVEIEKKN